MIHAYISDIDRQQTGQTTDQAKLFEFTHFIQNLETGDNGSIWSYRSRSFRQNP